jgi:YggT family protein
MMNPVFFLIYEILGLYMWVVLAAVLVSWLIAFNVINTYNQFVRSLLRFLYAVTEPVFRQIRKIIPPIGGIDLSPLVVFVAIIVLQHTLEWLSVRYGL